MTLNNINNYYLNQKMIYFEDGLINYALHLNSKLLYLLYDIGYYYIYNNNSISHLPNLDCYLKCFFIYLNFFLEKTKNNKYEKDMVFFILQKYIQESNILIHIENFSEIYEKVINSIINIYFINSINKEKLKEFKKIILEIKKKNH